MRLSKRTGEKRSLLEFPLTGALRRDGAPLSRAEYEAAGGYQALRHALATMTPREVLEEVKRANLQGRGGAGFPAGRKWETMAPTDDPRRPRYLVVNADEMEPGTFKDRLLIEGNPHQLLEGAILSSYAVEADEAVIFLRWAYDRPLANLERAIAEAYESGYLGSNILKSGYSLKLSLHVSAGRYICGEQSALLNALEGKRGIPQPRTLHAGQLGLRGRPTIVNNAETLCNVPPIIRNGAEWFLKLSATAGSGGTKIYGVSGHVRRPGAWELPLGITLRELIEDRAGGMAAGYSLRGLIPGGASSDFLLPEHLDVKMDFESLDKAGSRLGTGAVVALDDRTCPVGFVLALERFFARESCGWCTPCREGLPWTERILQALEAGEGEEEDLETLMSLVSLLGMGRTFCVLAPGAVMPLRSALNYFREDFARHVKERKCPWEGRQ